MKKRNPRARMDLRNPELPTAGQLECPKVYLKSEPDLIEGVQRVMNENGYRSVSEAVRHLMRVAISATPIDGEYRAAMNSVKGQMTQHFTLGYWTLLKQLQVEFERTFGSQNAAAVVEAEIQRLRDASKGGQQ